MYRFSIYLMSFMRRRRDRRDTERQSPDKGRTKGQGSRKAKGRLGR
jgi:hypothetical protein